MDRFLVMKLFQRGTWPKTWNYVHKAADFECHIQDINGIQLISFAGSKSFMDYFLDMLFIPFPYHFRLVHLGISIGMRRAWRKYIKNNVDFDKKTIVEGHSLGGARAHLFHRIYGKKFRDISTVSFAAPRVEWFLTRFFGKKINVTRFEMRGDIVPHLPPWLFGFFHYGKKTKIGPKKFLDFKAHPPEVYMKNLGV